MTIIQVTVPANKVKKVIYFYKLREGNFFLLLFIKIIAL